MCACVEGWLLFIIVIYDPPPPSQDGSSLWTSWKLTWSLFAEKSLSEQWEGGGGWLRSPVENHNLFPDIFSTHRALTTFAKRTDFGQRYVGGGGAKQQILAFLLRLLHFIFHLHNRLDCHSCQGQPRRFKAPGNYPGYPSGPLGGVWQELLHQVVLWWQNVDMSPLSLSLGTTMRGWTPSKPSKSWRTCVMRSTTSGPLLRRKMFFSWISDWWVRILFILLFCISVCWAILTR